MIVRHSSGDPMGWVPGHEMAWEQAGYRTGMVRDHGIWI